MKTTFIIDGSKFEEAKKEIFNEFESFDYCFDQIDSKGDLGNFINYEDQLFVYVIFDILEYEIQFSYDPIDELVDLVEGIEDRLLMKGVLLSSVIGKSQEDEESDDENTLECQEDEGCISCTLYLPRGNNHKRLVDEFKKILKGRVEEVGATYSFSSSDSKEEEISIKKSDEEGTVSVFINNLRSRVEIEYYSETGELYNLFNGFLLELISLGCDYLIDEEEEENKFERVVSDKVALIIPRNSTSRVESENIKDFINEMKIQLDFHIHSSLEDGFEKHSITNGDSTFEITTFEDDSFNSYFIANRKNAKGDIFEFSLAFYNEVFSRNFVGCEFEEFKNGTLTHTKKSYTIEAEWFLLHKLLFNREYEYKKDSSDEEIIESLRKRMEGYLLESHPKMNHKLAEEIPEVVFCSEESVEFALMLIRAFEERSPKSYYNKNKNEK